MPNCSVFKCDYAYAQKDGTYQSYRFPKDSKMREKWMKILNREDYVLTDSSCFCSKHFAEEAFVSDAENVTKKGKPRARRTLKPLAIPTLFLRPEKKNKPRTTQRSAQAQSAMDLLFNTSNEDVEMRPVETVPTINDLEPIVDNIPNVEETSNVEELPNTATVPIVEEELILIDGSDMVVSPDEEVVEMEVTNIEEIAPPVTTNNEEIKQTEAVSQNPTFDPVQVVDFINYCVKHDHKYAKHPSEKVFVQVDLGAQETVDHTPRDYGIPLSKDEVIDQLRDFNEYLRKRLIDDWGVYEKRTLEQEQKVEELEKENESLNLIVLAVQKLFRPDQVHRLTSPGTRAEWSKISIQEFIALKTICGPTAYQYLYDKGYPVAHLRTLANHLAKIECQPPILYDFMALTELKMATKPARDKYVALVLDEMSIQPRYVFDNHTQSFLGQPTVPASHGLIKKRLAKDPSWDQEEALATHALNAMIHGMGESFKANVGVHFTDNGFDAPFVAKWMKTLIQLCYNMDAIVKAIVMDMGGQNLPI